VSAAVIVMAFEVHVAGVFVPQLIAVVTLNDCGPLPSGGSTPGAIDVVNCHVPHGDVGHAITPLSPSRIVKEPVGPSKPDAVVDVNG
jgi:hypothetical protein